MTSAVLLLSLMIGSLYVVAAEEQSIPPWWVGCTSHQDCRPGSCCVMGQQRFSIPQCTPQPQLGDPCRPTDLRVTDTKYTYPDGSSIFVKDAYLSICPCNIGLTCNRTTGTCQV